MNNIFIIDDDPTNNFIVEILVKSVFPEIKPITFTNPLQALVTLGDTKLEKGDIIFLDLNMPQINGFQFLDKFKDKKMNCRVFILTSSLNPVDRELAEKNPAVNGFILKPLTKEKIINLCC